MMSGLLALTVSSVFAGAAFYINFAEQPARMRLEPGTALQQWRPSYKRGFMMQASLAIIGSVFALWAYIVSSDWRWLAGGAFLIANWPYTVFAMLPLNNRMMQVETDGSENEVTSMLSRWNRLHALRTVLGIFASVIFIWTLVE